MKYVISDIHGEYDMFCRLMKKISFSAADELLVCGDFLEKGDKSVELARFLRSQKNIRCIKGNHEDGFIKYYSYLMQQSDDYDSVLDRLKEYLQGDGHLLDWETVEWIAELPCYIEEEDFILVHAGLPLDESGYALPLDTVPEEELLYNRRFRNPDVLPKGKCVFFGHTQTPNRLITGYKIKGATNGGIRDYSKVWLDCGAWHTDGRLGVFCIDTLKCFYVTK